RWWRRRPRLQTTQRALGTPPSVTAAHMHSTSLTRKMFPTPQALPHTSILDIVTVSHAFVREHQPARRQSAHTIATQPDASSISIFIDRLLHFFRFSSHSVPARPPPPRPLS